MTCEICKRSSCTRSFHSIEDQLRFDAGVPDLEDEIDSLRQQVAQQAEQLRVAKEALEFVANRKYQTYIDRQVLEALAKLERSEVLLEGGGNEL